MNPVSYPDALAAVTGACGPAPARQLSLNEAPGAVPAEEVAGRVASPAFNNAAMDGFALRAEDTEGASRNSPVDLRIVGDLKAGASSRAAVPGSGCVMRVDTGALVPPPLDTVIAREHATMARRGGAEFLRLREAVGKGRNLRLKGEEYPAGARFDYRGKRLRSGHIAHLSSAGVSRLRVRTPPPLALLTTGDEVRPGGATLAPGEIFNVNASWLASWCAERNLSVSLARHVPDDAGRLARAVEDACDSGARVLLSSGSASAGKHDVLREALGMLGARVVFHGVAMRPGKPALFALLEGGVPVFGLPGNPLATAAGMRFLAWPGVRAIMGMHAERPKRARLADPCDLREGLTHFLLAKRAGDDGRVSLVHPQRPAQAGALAAADCWLRLEGGRNEAGARVDSYPL